MTPSWSGRSAAPERAPGALGERGCRDVRVGGRPTGELEPAVLLRRAEPQCVQDGHRQVPHRAVGDPASPPADDGPEEGTVLLTEPVGCGGARGVPAEQQEPGGVRAVGQAPAQVRRDGGPDAGLGVVVGGDGRGEDVLVAGQCPDVDRSGEPLPAAEVVVDAADAGAAAACFRRLTGSS